MIGIIGALQIEVDSLREMIKNPTIEKISGVEYVLGNLNGENVVIACCGVGKVFAAICAQTMILKYNVTKIINTGVAGSLVQGLDILDIAVSSYVVQHDMDTCAIGDEPGLISGINKVFLQADSLLVEKTLSIAKDLEIKATKGIIASGDKFIASLADKIKIRTTFGAFACEMEGAAIAQVCYVNNISFIVIRAISDSADGNASEDFPTFASKAAKRSIKIIEGLLS